jgi:hypothetical protein
MLTSISIVSTHCSARATRAARAVDDRDVELRGK